MKPFALSIALGVLAGAVMGLAVLNVLERWAE